MINAKTYTTAKLTPPRNGQTQGIRWARDYELTAERITTLFAPSF